MNKMVGLIIVGAGLLAIATYLIITSITESPPLTEQAAQPSTPAAGATPPAEVVTVGDVAVALNTQPDKRVRLQQELEAEQSEALEAQQQAQEGAIATAEATAAGQPGAEQPTAAAPTPAQPPVQPAPASAQITFADYVVQSGDTLFSLTQKFNTTIELMAQHNIAAGNIVPGTQLRIPIANTAYCGGGTAYVVQPGDTVFSIARRYGTDVETVRARNNLGADYRINVNQVLCLP